MIGNNSSRQRVDRARHDDRPRARARGRAGRRVARHALGDARAPDERRRAPHLRRRARRSCATTRGRSPRTTRATGASPAATGSTGMDPFDLAKLVVGLRGHARDRRPRRPSGWSSCRRRRCSRSGTSTRCWPRSPPPTTRSRCEPCGGRDDRPHDPRPLALQARVPAARRPPRGRPRGAAVRLLLRRRPTTRCATSSTSCERAWREHGHGYHTLRAETAAEQAALTKVRKAGLGLLMAASEGRTRPAAFVEDTAVAPERLVDYVARVPRDPRARTGCSAGFYGHCSVGCLHIRPYVDLSRPEPGRDDAARSPRRSSTSSPPSTASTPPSTATGASARRSTRASSATSSTARCARSSGCSTRRASSTRA